MNVNDRMGDREDPLCAPDPHHRGNMGIYPRSIQSFIRFFLQRRSNSAQRGIPHITTLLTLTLTLGSHPGLSPTLSPGLPLRARRVAHQECSTVTSSVPGTVVYPGCTVGRYIPGYITMVHREAYSQVSSTMVHREAYSQVYTTRVYLRVYIAWCTLPGYTSGCT